MDYGQRQHRKSCNQRQIWILTKQFRYPMRWKPRKKTLWLFWVQKTAVHNVEATKSVRKSENRKKFQRKHAEECFRCGNNHYPSECRFKESKCFKCQKRRHISKGVQLRKTLINQLSLWTEGMAIHPILRTVFVPSFAPTKLTAVIRCFQWR